MAVQAQVPPQVEKKPSPAFIDVFDPRTGQAFDHIPVYTREMVQEVAARARTAQPAWAALSVQERCKILKRFADLLLEQQEQMMKVLRRETGKADGGAFAEVAVVTNVADYYTRHAPKWLKPQPKSGFAPIMYSAKMYFKPLGVVGNISPWNYPLVLSLMDMIPALLAGNAVIVKPSEITPFSTIEAARILREAGLPENIFQVITGAGETGSALVDYVDFIMFTGSTATGRKVGIRAAERLIPFSLELGGNDPMIVLDDADMDVAASWAVRAGFENAGQVCMAVERVLVEEKVYEPFLEALRKWQKKLKIGKGDGFDVHMGSMTNRRELQRTIDHIEDAKAKGARVVTGGKPMPELGPLFYEATVIAEATPDMTIMQDETFGPVISVTRVKDVDEAIRIANDSNYGLSASVFSKNLKRAEEVAVRIESGDVNINCVMFGFGTPDLEFGGVKESGVGRRNGQAGLYKYVQKQSIAIDRLSIMPAPTIYTPLIRRLFLMMHKARKFLPFIGT